MSPTRPSGSKSSSLYLFIFKGLGVDYESLQSEGVESTVFVSPEIENDMARNPGKYKNQPMPTPKVGEDHNWHETEHIRDLQENGWNEQIADHLVETRLVRQTESGEGTIPPPDQPQESLLAPGDQGPQGPLQKPTVQ